MDIRCPSCSTLYEFDESRIGPAGVNVRCSACGHVFKVRTAAPSADTQWMVKRSATGEVIYFDELSTLQRWIIEQKVAKHDKISKTGDTWKHLGSIQELTAFFKVVDELNAPRNESQNTDGYLTAPQQRPPTTASPASVGTFRPPDDHPGGDAPVELDGGVGTQLMPGLEPARDSAVTPHAGGATVGMGGDVYEMTRVAGRQRAAAMTPMRASEVTDPPKPAGRGARRPHQVLKPNDGYSLRPSGKTTEAYTLGESGTRKGKKRAKTGADIGSVPIHDTGDFSTADYREAARGRSRWPLVLLALLLIGAGGVIISTLFRDAAVGSDDVPALADPDDADQDQPVAALTPDTGGPDTEAVAPTDDDSGADADDDVADASAAEAEIAPAEDVAPPSPDVAARAEPPTRDRAPDVRTERRTRDTRTTTEPTRVAAPTRSPEPDEPPSAPVEPEAPAGGYDGLMSAGNEALRAGRNQEALNAFSAAAEARSNSAEAHVGVARSYEAMGRHDLAAVRYQRATGVNSRYTPAWLGLGDAWRRSGDSAGAREAYERVISIVRTGRSADRAREALELLQ